MAFVYYAHSDSRLTQMQSRQRQGPCLYLLYTKKFPKLSQWSESTYLDAKVSLSKIKERWFPRSLIGNTVGYWEFHLRRSRRENGHVHVLHTAPQTRLNSSRVPPEDPHHRCPAQTCKDWPRIALHLLSQLSSHSHPSLTSPLYR